jgi:hypothetical protein
MTASFHERVNENQNRTPEQRVFESAVNELDVLDEVSAETVEDLFEDKFQDNHPNAKREVHQRYSTDGA